MKVYRVLPDIFVTDYRLDNTVNIVVEGLYYKMGFVSFANRKTRHGYNSLNCEGKEGKYFFLFMEDAIIEGFSLINVFHDLRARSFLIVEYDIPTDLIMKNIGYGSYMMRILEYEHLIESFIEENEFGEVTLVKESEIKKALLEEFKDGLNRIKRFGNLDDIQYYSNIFWTDILRNPLKESEIKSVLEESPLFYSFLNEKCVLRLSPYITGKIVHINFNSDIKSYEKICESLGINCDFSVKHQRFKERLLNIIDEKDTEKAIRLLRDKSYI